MTLVVQHRIYVQHRCQSVSCNVVIYTLFIHRNSKYLIRRRGRTVVKRFTKTSTIHTPSRSCITAFVVGRRGDGVCGNHGPVVVCRISNIEKQCGGNVDWSGR